jgi:hypothetical protein
LANRPGDTTTTDIAGRAPAATAPLTRPPPPAPRRAQPARGRRARRARRAPVPDDLVVQRLEPVEARGLAEPRERPGPTRRAHPLGRGAVAEEPRERVGERRVVGRGTRNPASGALDDVPLPAHRARDHRGPAHHGLRGHVAERFFPERRHRLHPGRVEAPLHGGAREVAGELDAAGHAERPGERR